MQGHEGSGVIPVDLAPIEEGQTVQSEYMAEREVRNLKYQPPALEKLDKAKLSSDMILCLEPLMDWSKMNDEMRELWDDMVENVDTETDISEDEFDSNETNELEISGY